MFAENFVKLVKLTLTTEMHFENAPMFRFVCFKCEQNLQNTVRYHKILIITNCDFDIT